MAKRSLINPFALFYCFFCLASRQTKRDMLRRSFRLGPSDNCWLAGSLLLRRCVSDLGSLPSPPHPHQLQQKGKLDSNNRKWQVASLSPAHKTLSTVLPSSSACRCRKMMPRLFIMHDHHTHTQVPCSCIQRLPLVMHVQTKFRFIPPPTSDPCIVLC